jgi:hypothetical protein
MTSARLPLCAAAVAILFSGCGGSVYPHANNSFAIQPLRRDGRLPHSPAAYSITIKTTWMLPNAKSIKKLLYVAGGDTNAIEVYNYKTGALVGELSGFDQPMGECLDRKGDIWITNWASSSIVEYAHGGKKPLATLDSADKYGSGCSIDPTNGDLAVSTFYGTLDVWKNARGTPTNYASTACPFFWGPGYDNKGNLFVESQASSLGPFVCELPHRAKALRAVPFDQRIFYGADVIWDGEYIAFGDQVYHNSEASGMYQAKLDASENLKLVGSTSLLDSCYGFTDVEKPFVVGAKNTPANHKQGRTVIGSDSTCRHVVDFWSYPAGGHQSSTLRSQASVPWATVVSVAP